MDIRLGKVVAVYANYTIDVLLFGLGLISGVPVLCSLITTNTGTIELPVLKTSSSVQPGPFLSATDLATPLTTNPNLTIMDTANPQSGDLDDPDTNSAYAVIAFADRNSYKTAPYCLGFIPPFRTQMMFDPQNVSTSLPQPTQDAVKKMGGSYLKRTKSDVYFIVDGDGNIELAHPNGSFLRIAESPTQNSDGTIHVDLTNANTFGQTSQNLGWNTTRKLGADGNPNNQRKLYFHMEIVTEQGTVELDVDKSTGNITIQTPKDTSSASQSNNQVTIIAGGDATIKSVAGNVTIQSAQQGVSIEAQNTITIQTDSAGYGSLSLAPNAPLQDSLVLLGQLMTAYNSHTHIAPPSGGETTPPIEPLTQSAGTTVTIAG